MEANRALCSLRARGALLSVESLRRRIRIGATPHARRGRLFARVCFILQFAYNECVIAHCLCCHHATPQNTWGKTNRSFTAAASSVWFTPARLLCAPWCVLRAHRCAAPGSYRFLCHRYESASLWWCPWKSRTSIGAQPPSLMGNDGAHGSVKLTGAVSICRRG